MSFTVGIDVGLGGAIAVLDDAGNVAVHDCPIFDLKGTKREVDAVGLAALFKRFPEGTRVVIERAQFMPGQGGSSSFNYGTGYGVYKGIIAATGLVHVMVAPGKWKRDLAVSKDKEDARRQASRLMPQGAIFWPLKKHHGRAEAALIAYWGRHVYFGDTREAA